VAAEAPTGTVTFLFTDIEGSTRLWEDHGDAMGAALARHDEIARSAFDAHGGYVFATGGDGFAVAFASAAGGLAAATATQAALAGEPWDGVILKVRMGVHIGEAEERDGDYFGPAVNKAARVMAAGHGGQILATEACAQVVGSGALAELGEFQLRDLSGPQRVYQVGGDEFPPLRTIDAYPSNLPQNLSTFVGREAQVAQLVEDLRNADLVTLTGAGGVGKTRLAVQACAESLPKFPGGAWFVDLAPVRDPRQVAGAVAAVLGVKERAGEALEVTLRDSMRDREAVVLLDNGEHVVDALAELIQALRSREIATKFLITSREPLGVDGEQVRRVVSLDSRESVDLFVQRAASVRSEVDWASYREDVLEICERLDGIPLAIELAAARSRSMLPPDILARLDERFRLLAGGKRAAMERHQTLLAAVDWSYDLLTEDERALFDRLAVFQGGFSLAATEAVCSGGIVDEFAVVDLLDRLVDKSMVLAFEVGNRSRYRLLETLRQYAESRLAESGLTDEYKEAHLDHFEGFVSEWMPLIQTPQQTRAAAELRAEASNVDAALGWLLATDRWPELRKVCAQLHGYWTATAAPDGPHWYGVLLDNLDRLEVGDQARVLAEASYTVANGGAYREGRELAERALAAADAAGKPRSTYAYFALCQCLGADGDDEAAIRFAVLGKEAAREVGLELLEYICQSTEAGALLNMGHPDAAAAVAATAEVAERLGVPQLVAGTLMDQARKAILAGDIDAAGAFLAEAIVASRETVPHVVIAANLYRSQVRLEAGDARVLEGVDEALETFAATPVQPDFVADIWAIIATVWLREGRLDDAALLASAAAALLTSLGVRGRSFTAYIRQQLGDDLAAAMSAEELDDYIVKGQEMTADDVHRFILERL
jgi:predicted ATPase/class 3 adenylate cyclase